MIEGHPVTLPGCTIFFPGYVLDSRFWHPRNHEFLPPEILSCMLKTADVASASTPGRQCVRLPRQLAGEVRNSWGISVSCPCGGIQRRAAFEMLTVLLPGTRSFVFIVLTSPFSFP